MAISAINSIAKPVVATMEKVAPQPKMIKGLANDTFQKNKDLSDSSEFKKAWKQDAQNLGKRSLSNFLFKKCHIDYYVFDVDITDGVTDDEVEEADSHRSEIFAQLFSYAMGEDDGQKKAIVEKYSNCYRMVKLYIKKYLGIDMKNN